MAKSQPNLAFSSFLDLDLFRKICLYQFNISGTACCNFLKHSATLPMIIPAFLFPYLARMMVARIWTSHIFISFHQINHYSNCGRGISSASWVQDFLRPFLKQKNRSGWFWSDGKYWNLRPDFPPKCSTRRALFLEELKRLERFPWSPFDRKSSIWDNWIWMNFIVLFTIRNNGNLSSLEDAR